MRVVYDYWDTTVRVEAEKPFFFLLVGHNIAIKVRKCRYAWIMADDIHKSVGEFSAISLCKLFKENLNFLSIGCTLGDQMKSL